MQDWKSSKANQSNRSKGREGNIHLLFIRLICFLILLIDLGLIPFPFISIFFISQGAIVDDFLKEVWL